MIDSNRTARQTKGSDPLNVPHIHAEAPLASPPPAAVSRKEISV